MIGRRDDSSGVLGGPWEVHWDFTHSSSSGTSMSGDESALSG